MIKPSRLSLRLQIRSFKNTFFQLNDLPFKGLLPDSLINAIHYQTSTNLSGSRQLAWPVVGCDFNASLAELYQQRWQIEVDFRSIKTHMGMDMLRCKTAEMVKKEIAIHLLAYNLIRTNIARAASLNAKEPRHLSFMAAVQLMRNTASLCITLTETASAPVITVLFVCDRASLTTR